MDRKVHSPGRQVIAVPMKFSEHMREVRGVPWTLEDIEGYQVYVLEDKTVHWYPTDVFEPLYEKVPGSSDRYIEKPLG